MLIHGLTVYVTIVGICNIFRDMKLRKPTWILCWCEECLWCINIALLPLNKVLFLGTEKSVLPLKWHLFVNTTENGNSIWVLMFNNKQQGISCKCYVSAHYPSSCFYLRTAFWRLGSVSVFR
jgi:hypothetical protein